MDQRLEEDMIFTLLASPHQTQSPTQTLDSTTAHHLATIMDPPPPSHSWRVVAAFNLTKWKSFMKLPEGIEEFEVLALHALHNKKNNLCRLLSVI